MSTVKERESVMHYRRFGRTEFQMPVISCGGMRFQESWKSDDAISDPSQKNLEACVHKALESGINHFETARGYGTSEEQLGRILPKLPREAMLVQTKVAPMPDVEKFKATFEKSMRLLKLDYIDLFAFHGLNNQECLDNALRCWDAAQKWRDEGRIRAIGFSTHGLCRDIVNAIETGRFDYVNLHWYYFFQENWPAVEAATRHDMGVFIISPNDKGGKLYEPSEKLRRLTAPLHPMAFNGLFCLSHPEVHTLSCGVSKPEDFDVHLDMLQHLDEASETVAPIVGRLERELREMLGDDWAETWRDGLPEWHEAPGEVNVPWVLRLRNLALAYDMVGYGKMRYNLLGKGGHWFPGNKAGDVDALDWSRSLQHSPNANVIPAYLKEAHELLDGAEVNRLQES